ncbi:MAG: APC family permease [Chitinophagaceae bacterium]|nr:APC family permease [Chitinophagaceae bacterium]
MNNSNQLRFFDFVFLVISLVIGLGIFSTPAKVAALAPNAAVFYGLWILGGLMALAGALVYAELGTLVPESGAYYKIFSKAYHPSVGFAVNILIFICNAASLGIVCLIGAEYCEDLVGISSKQSWFPVLFSGFCLTLFLWVNLKGLKTSSGLLNILLLIKLALMLVLISTLFKSDREVVETTIQPEAHTSASWLNDPKMLLACLIPICFTYGGYQQTINFGNEIRSTRFMRRGILLGILVVIILYLVLNLAYVHTLGFSQLQGAKAIGATLFSVWFGRFGAQVFDVLVVLSVMAYTNVLLMSNPLVMHAMANDGLLPKVFAKQHSQTGARTIGLLTFYFIAMMIVFVGKEVDNIMGFTMFLDSVGMIASAGTLFMIRKKYLASGGTSSRLSSITPWLVVLYMVYYTFVASGVIWNDTKAASIGLLLFVAMLLLGFFIQKKEMA